MALLLVAAVFKYRTQCTCNIISHLGYLETNHIQPSDWWRFSLLSSKHTNNKKIHLYFGILHEKKHKFCCHIRFAKGRNQPTNQQLHWWAPWTCFLVWALVAPGNKQRGANLLVFLPKRSGWKDFLIVCIYIIHIHTFIHTLHYITLHYITLYYIILYYIILYYIRSQHSTAHLRYTSPLPGHSLIWLQLSSYVSLNFILHDLTPETPNSSHLPNVLQNNTLCT